MIGLEKAQPKRNKLIILCCASCVNPWWISRANTGLGSLKPRHYRRKTNWLAYEMPPQPQSAAVVCYFSSFIQALRVPVHVPHAKSFRIVAFGDAMRQQRSFVMHVNNSIFELSHTFLMDRLLCCDTKT